MYSGTVSVRGATRPRDVAANYGSRFTKMIYKTEANLYFDTPEIKRDQRFGGSSLLATERGFVETRYVPTHTDGPK
jgi:hypothetical protein